MATRYLGLTVDLHGGGKDLVFPHHENEIAQSETAFEAPFVRYWVHNGFVNVNNEKMSKSLGNFFTIRDVLRYVHPESLRLFVLSKHYRSPVDFSDEALREAERGIDRLYGAIEFVQQKAAKSEDAEYSGEVVRMLDPELYEKAESLPALFAGAMSNDFNTAQAIGYIFVLQRNLQRFLDKFGNRNLKGPAAQLARKAADSLLKQCNTLGLLMLEPGIFLDQQRRLKLKTTGVSEKELNELIALRHKARQEKNFTEADRIRLELEAKHVHLEDFSGGTKWRVSF
jgi:cysteinyl-tRNA synthetase